MVRYTKILLLGVLFLAIAIPGGSTEVELKKGETLYSLARRYEVPVDELLAFNAISDPTKVKAGTLIKIPRVYTLQRGETLYKVSRLYKVTVEELMRHNGIRDPSSLKVGTRLLIPGDGPAAETADPAGTTASGGDPPPTPGGALPLLWPHPGKREPFNNILQGVTISGNPGDRVVAVSPGEVIWADPFRKFGKAVFIRSRDNCIYGYAGNEELLVKVGDQVAVETALATLGANAPDGSALAYFFIYKDGQALNPDHR